MKKTLPGILLGVAMICIVAAYMFLDPENSQDLSFLNYENLVAAAAQTDGPTAHRSGDAVTYSIDGARLAQFLDTADWKPQTGLTRKVQRDTEENSTESIQIALNGVYLKLFDTDTANIYDETTGKDRFYRMSAGDYAEVLALLMPAG